MIREIKGFDHTDEFQWVKKIDKGHYKIIDGKELAVDNMNFACFNINFYDDDLDLDRLDELINEYYSSCTDFFLAATDDNRDEQMQFIAEMIAEQEWQVDPVETCTLPIKELDKMSEEKILSHILEHMEPVSF